MNILPRVRPILYAAIAALPAWSPAQDPAQDPEEAAPVKPGVVPEWQMDYENLTREDRENYAELISEASRLFNQKRIFESLNALGEAEAIFDEFPTALNLEGACYVEFRDFGKAREKFNRALILQK